MAKFIPENIETLLSTFKFDIDDECINEDLTCTICKKLLHDVYQSTCDCKYCLKCIVSYINDGNEYCPGGKDECREDLLVLDETVLSNAFLNKKVLKVVLRCPNESCQFASTLSQMEDHLRVCSLQPMECPYTKIGCANVRVNRESVDNHLNKDMLAHSQMLMEVVDNLKNEVGGLKEQIASLREESVCVAVVVQELKGEVAALRGQIKCAEEEETPGIINGRVGELTKKVDSLSKWINKGDAVGSLWFTVDGFDDLMKKDVSIFSPHFYSHINGYKLRIQVNVAISLGIWFGVSLHVSSVICKGEYDDVLSWPASGLSVSVTLINHHTKEAYETGTIKYDNKYCSKPIDKDNKPYGGYCWVSLSDLASTPGMIVSDCLLLLVTANPP